MAPKSKSAPAAPKAAPSFQFGDAEVPAVVRKSTAVNPLSEVCAALAATLDAEKGRTPGAKVVTAADEKQVKQIKRWLALAGPDNNVTFRSTVDGNKVTFWAVSRITQNRKPKG